MDPDPMHFLEADADETQSKTADAVKKSRINLNTLVAIDDYSWYQARNIREEVARATVAQLTALATTAPPQAQTVYQGQIKAFQAIAQEEEDKKKIQQADAERADKTYNELNYHDDQFDLSDAMLALAISLLAMTALTQKRWLFALALLPTMFGVIMGLAALFGWHIHPDALTRLLS